MPFRAGHDGVIALRGPGVGASMTERLAGTGVTARVTLAHEPDFALGGLEIRPSRREIAGEGIRETVEPRVMRVLVALARARAEILSRDDLIASCWDGVIVGEDAINRCISQLRKAADACGDAFSIETIPRVGYRLNVADTIEAAPATDVRESREPDETDSYPAPAPNRTAAPHSGMVFNHDLMMDAADARAARQAFPAIFDLLDWPRLRDTFAIHELSANRAKKQSRASGVAALAVALTVLWIAVLVPELHAYLPRTPGLRSVIVGVGILAAAGLVFACRARMMAGTELWLHHRAATERLRQLHFQFLVRRARHLATEAAAVKSAALRERDRLLELIAQDLKPGVTKPVAAIIEDAGGTGCWLVGRSQPDYTPAMRPSALAELFHAYRRLRIQHQADYVTKKLAPRSGGLWPPRPLSEARRLSAAGKFLIALVVACEVSVLVVLTFGAANGGWIGAALQAVATLAAFGALAMRIMEDGIRPRSEIARLRNYRGEILELLRRFETAQDPTQKLLIMEQMEELSYREMRDFLSLHHEGQFAI